MDYRQQALDMLKSRRPYHNSPLECQARTSAAWKLLQMAMRKPSQLWTDTPPRVTVTS